MTRGIRTFLNGTPINAIQIDSNRFDDHLAVRHERVLKRVGIQYWRIASTTAGIAIGLRR